MKHPTEERASERSCQEVGGGTSSTTGAVSQLDNSWSWPAVLQGANSNQANKWVQTKCEKQSKEKKKWIAEKKVKKVPNNFKLRAGLASWLASQASWEWPSSMPIENRIFVVFFSLSTHKGGARGRDLFMPVHDNISGNEAWLLIEVCCAMSVVRRVYVMSYPRTHTPSHTDTDPKTTHMECNALIKPDWIVYTTNVYDLAVWQGS